MNDANTSSPAFCFNCGSQLRPEARFCPSCGARIQASAAQSSVEIDAPPAVPAENSTGAQPENPFIIPGPPTAEDKPDPSSQGANSFEVENQLFPTEPTPLPGEPAAEPAPEPDAYPSSTGYSLSLDAVPPQARGRTILALRQVLNLSPQEAGMYVSSAPLLLAVGLPPEMAETLRAALSNAGAVVTVAAPPVREEPKPTGPVPEPRRRLSSQDKTMEMKRIQVKSGVYTVTGLDLGSTNAYLAFARADGSRLVAPPEMINLDSQASVPAVLGSSGLGKPPVVGLEALKNWVQSPETVRFVKLDQVGVDDGALPVLRAFLEVLATRLNRVLMPGALAIAEGANTKLAVPADWDLGRSERLVEMATQAGFPVSRVVPAPVAVLAHHRQQGTLRQTDRLEKTMVMDWGGTSLAISFIEHGGDLNRPRVFEHIEHPLGGNWFDNIIYKALEQQIGRSLNETDQRAFLLFARRFKEQMSNAFSEGKSSCAQYCAIPPGAPPVRVQLNRDEFETLAAEGLELFRQAILNAVDAVGLKHEHLDHVILAGGGGRWYFAREAARSVLRQAPLIGARPEEACARGLAVYNLNWAPER